ncbi:hypothetical protein CZ797_04345 [Pseudoalteromonas sp. JB197]|nr:hypothetical protein CZ797_04345 [Pseudoalteromonas sp. JB197]
MHYRSHLRFYNFYSCGHNLHLAAIEKICCEQLESVNLISISAIT